MVEGREIQDFVETDLERYMLSVYFQALSLGQDIDVVNAEKSGVIEIPRGGVNDSVAIVSPIKRGKRVGVKMVVSNESGTLGRNPTVVSITVREITKRGGAEAVYKVGSLGKLELVEHVGKYRKLEKTAIALAGEMSTNIGPRIGTRVPTAAPHRSSEDGYSPKTKRALRGIMLGILLGFGGDELTEEERRNHGLPSNGRPSGRHGRRRG